MRPFALFLLASACVFAQQKHMNENQVRDRGQTRPADESQSWTRGRLGTQQPLPEKESTYNGMLVDASCDDRTSLNLHLPPTQPELATTTAAPQSDIGVKVDPKTLKNERADALAHQTPDVVLRQPDPSCAITGSTRGFALLMQSGRLLNLNEGGNTLAYQAIYSTPEGRAMLNGTGGGVKPQVSLRGRVQGDRLIVDKVLKP